MAEQSPTAKSLQVPLPKQHASWAGPAQGSGVQVVSPK
jgi:hypothetical protein